MMLDLVIYSSNQFDENHFCICVILSLICTYVRAGYDWRINRRQQGEAGCVRVYGDGMMLALIKIKSYVLFLLITQEADALN